MANDQGRDVPTKKARQIASLLLEEHFANNRDNIATDYRSNLIMCADLGLNGEEKLNVRYKHEIDNPKVYKVTVGAMGTLDPADLLKCPTSANFKGQLMQHERIVTAMNVVIGHTPKI